MATVDFTELIQSARAGMDPVSWAYYQGTAGPAAEADRDQQAWLNIDLVPRVMAGLRSVDTAVTMPGASASTPVMVAATAAHGLAHPNAEIETVAGAADADAVMVYSSTAAVAVRPFGGAARTPWWAQVYVMRDKGMTDDYMAGCVEAGASALVLTVDHLGSLADAPFRGATEGGLTARPGNYPVSAWSQTSGLIDPYITPELIGRLADATGLPVYAKGILHPADAQAAVDAGAAGIVVSNHGRRQVAGVIPVAFALPDIVEAVAGRVPVLVDGGIRSGGDVFRALALGATAVGVGRPVLWALAAQGRTGVADVLKRLTAELRQVMAACGAANLAAINESMVRLARN